MYVSFNDRFGHGLRRKFSELAAFGTTCADGVKSGEIFCYRTVHCCADNDMEQFMPETVRLRMSQYMKHLNKCTPCARIYLFESDPTGF